MKKAIKTILIAILAFSLISCGGNFASSAKEQYNLARNYAGKEKTVDFNSLKEVDINQTVVMTNGLIKKANNGDIIQTASFKANFGSSVRTYFESKPLISMDADGKANYLSHNERYMFLNNFYYPRVDKYDSYGDMLLKNPLSVDNLYRGAIFLPLDDMFSSFDGAKNGKEYVIKMEVKKTSLSTFFSYFELFHPFLKLKYENEGVYSYFNPDSVKQATLSLKMTDSALLEAEFNFLINGVGKIADITVNARTRIQTERVNVPTKWA